MADKYDDLDDLLDDYDLQNKILSQSPGAGSSQPAAEPGSEPAASKEPATGRDSEAVPDLSALKLDEQLTPEESQELAKTLSDLMQGSGEGGHTALEALMASLTQADAALAADVSGSETPSAPASKQESAKPSPSPKDAPAPGSKAEPAPKSFEDTISATMDRLNQSQKPGENSEADIMERLLQDMQKSLGDGGSQGGMDGLLSALLSELSSKDVLYEPLKELHTNYPGWLEKNRDGLEPKERARLEKQQGIVADVISKFEEPGYSDDDAQARSYITDKMVEMQDTGAPPSEIVGDVAGGAFPGFPGNNAPPDLPGDCATQ